MQPPLRAQIQTDRIYLREITWQDVPDIHRMNTIPEIAQFNPYGMPPDENATKAILMPLINSVGKPPKRQYGWAVRLSDSHAFIGDAGLILAHPRLRRGEIYCHLLPQYWRQGLASEMMAAVVEFGFEQIGLNRIEASITTDNIPSIRGAEKMGFQHEGVLRQLTPIGNTWKDNCMLSLLRNDPRTRVKFTVY